MKPLTDLSNDEFGYIVDLSDRDLTLELFDLGCFPGDLIRIIENKADTDFITFRCRKNVIHLYREKARAIITHHISFHFCLN